MAAVCSAFMVDTKTVEGVVVIFSAPRYPVTLV